MVKWLMERGVSILFRTTGNVLILWLGDWTFMSLIVALACMFLFAFSFGWEEHAKRNPYDPRQELK